MSGTTRSAPLTTSRSTSRRSAARHAPIVDTAAPLFIVLYLVVAFAPFEVLIGPQVSVPSTALSAVGIAILVITPTDRLRRIPVSLPLVGFAVWAVLSAGWSDSTSTTILLLRVEVLPWVVLAMVVGTIPPRVAARTLLLASLALCAWSLASSLLLPASRELVVEDGIDAAFRGTFNHKNILGVFAVLTLAAVLALFTHRRRRLVIVLLVATVIGTRSATAGSGLLALGFVWFWMMAIGRGRSDRDRRLLLGASIASAIAALLSAFRLVPILLTLYDKDLTFSGRTIIWSATFGAIAQRPIQGYGLGGVFTEVPTNLTLELWRTIGFDAAHTHSGSIEVLIELGIVGFGLIVLFLVDLGRRSARLAARPADRRYGLWGALVLASVLVMSLAEPLLSGAYLGYLVLVWVVLARLCNEPHERHSDHPRSVFGIRRSRK